MSETNELLSAVREAVAGVTRKWDRAYYMDCTRRGVAPTEMYESMAEQGLFALGVPEEIGGSGGGLVATAAVMEEMSRAGTPPMLFSLTSFARQSVIRHGTPEQIRKYVEPTLTAEQTFCFAITEPDAGTNSFAMRTLARPRGDGTYILNGQKVFISGADQATHIMVVARTTPADQVAKKSDGISVFVIPRETPGVSMTPMNIDWKAPERQFSVWFDNVILPADSLIGTEGRGLASMFDSLNAERVVIAAWTLGLGFLALEKAVAYARERAPWGPPIGSYQAVSHPLAKAKAQLEAARAMNQRAAESFDRGEEAGDDANMAKYLASEAAYAAVDAAIQTHGGSGFDEDTDIITLYPMIRILRVAPLNNEMILNYIANHMLDLPRSY
ncbi:acyl-CoA dehydrogenase family protein [Rhodococcus sp. (in: high G+C Gram-positive bacteria)]|jgi:alkylation response protein AidB-like acyl-CoA dehydrogenase|uniref:acyl-CoA dehydrogenase family protein n=1 Tax=Rhodococcus sp. TaxID=1831 RepID=UPI0025809D87|nr:acyl-CoA dehydrogenase family protein [Rhodococcus sp. (in: high G+C Gram-positive bacteria)]MBQ7805752.1 acyl-CoA/acyl-ACP dehydrogenase [Rhodococcus sp. (in: high G+C Gram-positive bacteria)]